MWLVGGGVPPFAFFADTAARIHFRILRQLLLFDLRALLRESSRGFLSAK